MVERHKQRDDIIFVSLALNSKDELEDFLQQRDFEYQVVPNQGKFINETLDLQMYPTHIVIDKTGAIVKVVNKASELISFLENEEKNNLEEKKLPPSPPIAGLPFNRTETSHLVEEMTPVF